MKMDSGYSDMGAYQYRSQVVEIAQLRTEKASLADRVDQLECNAIADTCIRTRLEATIEQQAEVIEQMREAFNNCIVYDARQTLVQIAAWRVKEALAIQPSPEILAARDKRVAEACAKQLITIGAPGDGDYIKTIRSGVWKKYL